MLEKAEHHPFNQINHLWVVNQSRFFPSPVPVFTCMSSFSVHPPGQRWLCCLTGVNMASGSFFSHKDTWKNGGDPTSSASSRLNLGRICRTGSLLRHLETRSPRCWRWRRASDELNEVPVKVFGPRRPNTFSAKLWLLRLIVFVSSSSDIRDRCESWILHLSHLRMMADAELPSILEPVGVIKTRVWKHVWKSQRKLTQEVSSSSDMKTSVFITLTLGDALLAAAVQAWDWSAAVGLTRLLASRPEVMTEWPNNCLGEGLHHHPPPSEDLCENQRTGGALSHRDRFQPVHGCSDVSPLHDTLT